MDMTGFTGNSDYLKATDLGRKRPRVRIKGVHTREFTDDKGTKEKPLLEFDGKDKMMVCNITNTRRLCEAFGTDSDKWIGNEIELYSEETEMGPGLRVRILPEGDELDDDIPF